jgi:transcriptional regulator with XRE-family HTH domain
MSSEDLRDDQLIQMGARIRKARNEAGINQQQLADRAGLTRSTISLIECGRRDAQARSLLAIASALEITPDDILGTREKGVDG